MLYLASTSISRCIGKFLKKTYSLLQTYGEEEKTHQGGENKQNHESSLDL